MTEPVRKRNREPASKIEVSKEIVAQAEAKYLANQQKNEATKRENAAQKELDSLMAKASDGKAFTFEHTFKMDGRKVTVDVTYAPGETVVINASELKRHVSASDLLDMASFTQGKVKAIAGQNILNLCKETVKGEFKTTVKARK